MPDLSLLSLLCFIISLLHASLYLIILSLLPVSSFSVYASFSLFFLSFQPLYVIYPPFFRTLFMFNPPPPSLPVLYFSTPHMFFQYHFFLFSSQSPCVYLPPSPSPPLSVLPSSVTLSLLFIFPPLNTTPPLRPSQR